MTCAECQAGQLRRHYITYFTWLGNELITVPDFPSWVCDVCGRREYDPQALNRLMMLLSPEAGKLVKKKRTKKQTRASNEAQPPKPDAA
ncbi:MAG: YgiT-type zinc finger protein [Anaerolineae bacterium]|nr:YgiT-type zinc finger protein [Anaerolineae bacterium]